ncbi:hypothetical protein EI94DRAFT_1726693 [Lactarius quietus]|nr:hypothetical protein EI94DRAFT_1726693 [Lactarius quietus]
MQRQSKPFSFKKTLREVFSPSEKIELSIPEVVDSVSSGSIGAGRDVAMGVIETSLAALQVGTLQMRGNKAVQEEWGAVMEKLADIASIVIDVGDSCQTHGLVEEDLQMVDLGGIEGALKQCAETNAIKRATAKYDAKLSNVLQSFQAKLLLDARLAQIVEKRKVQTVTQPEAITSPPFWQGPTAPQIFFGRDAELAQIVHMITANTGSHPARIAVLGPGGYGKTTIARAALTVKQILDHFGDARYFVPCESVTSSGALLAELGKALATLTSKDTIICFDNFESPWDQNVETKHSVEEVLSRVTELHCVTVLITMRGAERPARTQWTQPFLKPLETLKKLIEAVDYVPLLLIVTPPELLWEEWNSKQTKAIQTAFC